MGKINILLEDCFARKEHSLAMTIYIGVLASRAVFADEAIFAKVKVIPWIGKINLLLEDCFPRKEHSLAMTIYIGVIASRAVFADEAIFAKVREYVGWARSTCYRKIASLVKSTHSQ
jgi:hypothetical protein